MATAIVTGASGGLGLEFARLLANDGYNLVLVARSEQRLEEIARELSDVHDIDAYPVAADLATPEGLAKLTGYTTMAGISAEILINNAGFGDCSDFAQADINKLDRMVELNVRALMDLTYYYLADMLDHKSGRILNVASIASFEPGPGMATYFASKAFVLSLTEALAEELRGTGITCTALCPGTTNTNFWEVAESGELSQLRQILMASPKDIAAYGYRAMMRGQVVAVPGIVSKTLCTAVRLVPRALTRRIVSILLDRG